MLLVMTDGEIYAKHRDALVRYATALVGPDHAEDMLSTVLVRALRRVRLVDLDDAEAYLYRAVLNESRSFWRRARRPILLRPERSDALPDPLPEVIEALRRLPARQRAATYLVHYADLSIADAAELMGCAAGTVKHYLHAARARLRRDRRLRKDLA